MKKRFALLAFVGGLCGGYGYGVFESRYLIPYIDRPEAIRGGLEIARIHCSETRYTHPVDCVRFSLESIDETKTGWWMTFRSHDGRRSDSMWIGRRNEYDATGEDNLDGVAADGITQNSPAPPRAVRASAAGRRPPS